MSTATTAWLVSAGLGLVAAAAGVTVALSPQGPGAVPRPAVTLEALVDRPSPSLVPSPGATSEPSGPAISTGAPTAPAPGATAAPTSARPSVSSPRHLEGSGGAARVSAPAPKPAG